VVELVVYNFLGVASDVVSDVVYRDSTDIPVVSVSGAHNFSRNEVRATLVLKFFSTQKVWDFFHLN